MRKICLFYNMMSLASSKNIFPPPMPTQIGGTVLHRRLLPPPHLLTALAELLEAIGVAPEAKLLIAIGTKRGGAQQELHRFECLKTHHLCTTCPPSHCGGSCCAGRVMAMASRGRRRGKVIHFIGNVIGWKRKIRDKIKLQIIDNDLIMSELIGKH
jgi:hypothetical protein